MKKNIVGILLALTFTSCALDDNVQLDTIDGISLTEITDCIETTNNMDFPAINSDLSETTNRNSNTIDEPISQSTLSSSDLRTFELIPVIINDKSIYNNDIDDELKQLLIAAEHIYYNYFLEADKKTFNCDKTVSITVINENSDWVPSYTDDYYLTGYSYESFKKALTNVFSDKYVMNNLLKRTIYRENDGELCYYPFLGYCRNNSFSYIEFSVSDKSEDYIKVYGIAHYTDIDNPDDNWERKIDIDVINTENGWRIDSFMEWR